MPPRRPRGAARPGRTAAVVAAALAVALTGAGCTNIATQSPIVVLGPDPAAELQRFSTQQVGWGRCASLAPAPGDRTAVTAPGFDRALLEVPLDRADPAGHRARIAALRRKALDRARRIGWLLTNPLGTIAARPEPAPGR